jgi:alkyl sulfatase BDS1-like metallo-beta-lactamase superfamily hydrolase
VKLRINLVFSDTGEKYLLMLDRSVLRHARVDAPAADANATLTLTRPFFLRMMTGRAGAKDLLLSGDTRIDGSTLDLGRFFSLLDKAEGRFAIVPQPR